MKRTFFAAGLLLILLFSCFSASAEELSRSYGATEPIRSEQNEDDSVTKYYEFDSSAPVVDTEKLFFDGMNAEDSDTPVHFVLQSEQFSLRFSYDLLYRNTGKYADFSMQCTIGEIDEDTGLSAQLRKQLREHALYLDFPQEEHYPGIATLTVLLDRFAGQRVSLWRIVADEQGQKSLAPIADSVLLDEKGTLCLDVTESRDYLVVDASTAAAQAALLRGQVKPILISEGGLPRFAVILIIVVSAAVVGAAAAAVILLLKKRRKADETADADVEKKTLPKSRKNRRKRERGQNTTPKEKS